MRPNSLAFRLFASAVAWTLVVLPVTAILLVSLYRQALERNFDTRLNVYLTSLVASTTQEGAVAPKEPDRFRPAHIRHSVLGMVLANQAAQRGHAPRFRLRFLARPAAQTAEPERRLARSQPDAARLYRRSRRAAPAHRRARDQAGRPALRALFLCGRRRFRRDRPRSRRVHHHAHCGAGRARAWTCGGDLLPGAIWAFAVTRHSPDARRHPFGRSREARRRAARRDQAAATGVECADPVKSRDRRAGAHPCRQSRARAQDAAQRHQQRGADA